jgi:hypothetical protein
MLLNLWNELREYLRQQPYWSRIQPFVSITSIYLAATVLLYEYIRWQYHVSPRLFLYLRSYLFWQLTVVFIVLGLLSAVLRRPATEPPPRARVARWISSHGTGRVISAGLILLLGITVFLRLAPAHASHIRVRFLTEPGSTFRKNAIVYVLFELNKLQRSWYFTVDFDTLNPSELTTAERATCGDRSLCYAKAISGGEPFIGITTDGLGEDSFWQNDDITSVVSTASWDQTTGPSIYEYLAYAVVTQSVLIHLNAHCRGLPKESFRASRASHGDLFQFAPRREAVKAEVMAGRLTPGGEALLLNCFGIEYVTTCSRLITLDWLHEPRVTANLKRAYDITIPGDIAHP